MQSTTSYLRQVFIITFCVVAVAVCTPAGFGQTSKFKKGDRVEVDHVGTWREGTVVGVQRGTGWIQVRMDEDDFTRRLPKRSREFHLTHDFTPSDVRLLESGGNTKPPAAIRTWTDRTGKFKVDAQFGGVEGDNVVLIKAGGKRIQVPMAKLSDRDKGYVEAQGATAKSENPFGETGDATETASIDTKKANVRDARTIRPQTFSKWSFTPSGNTELMRPATGRNVEVELSDIPDSDKFFEDVTGVYASNDGTKVATVRNIGSVHQEKAPFLQIVDVANQRAGKLIELPEVTRVLDVQPDQGLVMYCPAVFGHGENSLLTIARAEGASLTPVVAWEPYAHEDFEPRKDLYNARFLGQDRVMTINVHGQALTIWDFATAKALLNIPVGNAHALKIAISPDQSLLGVVMKEGIAIIDLAVVKHVATILTPGHDYRQIQFRADNARLAGISSYGVTVWDLTNGKELSEFYSVAMGHDPSLAWAGEFLLAQNQYLYDVERRILLWEYQGDPSSAASAAYRNGRLYVIPYLNRERETLLVSAALPHRSAMEEAKRLPPPEKLLVVKPGDEVSLEVDIDPSVVFTDEAQKALTARIQEIGLDDKPAGNVVVLQPGSAQGDLVRQALTAALQEAGFKVVENADLVVKAVCKPQPQQTVRINADGRFPPRPEDFKDFPITPHESYLTMSLGNHQLWQRGFVARPHMTIWLNRGETVEQALQRLTQPDFSIFTHAKFSPYVARPGKATRNGAYGVSQFTARGIVDGGGNGTNGGSFE